MTRNLWIAALALAALLGGFAGAALLRGMARWRGALRRRRGRRGEQKAPAVLKAAGYRVLEEQPEGRAVLAVDGDARPYAVQADFLAARGEQRFVVEVKTGVKAPNPRKAATRRQLLEYRLVYEVDGVVLVDMERERVHRITWPELETPHRRPVVGVAWIALGAGLVLGAILGWFAAR